MAQQMYIIPIIHITTPAYNVPKYFPHRYNPNSLPELAGVRFAWETWLNEDVGIIVADVTPAQNTLIVAQADVVAIPALDSTIPNATVRNRVRAYLEAGYIPGNWVTTGMPYRSIVRIVLGMFQFHNRLVALIQKRVFDGSLNLEMTVSQIPLATRNAMIQAAIDLNLNYSAVTGTTTLRTVLKLMGDQFASCQFEIGGFVI